VTRSPENVQQTTQEPQTRVDLNTNPAELIPKTETTSAELGRVVRSRESLPWRALVLVSTAAVCCFLLAWLFFKHGQSHWNKSLDGKIVDPLRAGLPLSEVVLKSKTTKYQQEAKTDSDGWFEFDGLEPGTYDLEISHPAFRPIHRQIQLGNGSGNNIGRLVLDFEFNASQGGRNSKSWNWRDMSGRRRSTIELNRILEDHYHWLQSGAAEPPQKNEDDSEIRAGPSGPWRGSPSTELVGAGLKDAMLPGAVLSRANLSEIDLDDAFLESATLSGVDLAGANLTSADLFEADLTHAEIAEIEVEGAKTTSGARIPRTVKTILRDATLDGASLVHAKMRGADLEGASFLRTDLTGADMSNVRLDGARLSGANLTEANLSGAILHHANLGAGPGWGGANLSNAKLQDAQLGGSTWDEADVSGVIFEPAELPDGNEFAKARGLENLTYEESSWALVQIRKQFIDLGFTDQGRRITYAIMRSRTEKRWDVCTNTHEGPWEERDYGAVLKNCGEYFLNRIFFDLPCQYGMSSGRTLRIVGALWIFCSFLNYLLIRFARRSALLLIPSRVRGATDSDKKQLSIRRIQKIGTSMSKERQSVFARLGRQLKRKPLVSIWVSLGAGLRRWLRLRFRVLRAALFFSLLSVFDIGFREFNLGRRLPTVTRREYTLKAVGWIRVIAAWQSLISVYLIAIWFLTYFGRPFD